MAQRERVGEIGLLGLLLEELETWAEAEGASRYRGRQVFAWLHKKRIYNIDKMTDLPRPLVERLEALSPLLPASLEKTFESRDGTRKLLIRFPDGRAVETVVMVEAAGKVSVCVSTQVGCPVRCVFCRSGSKGLVRNLSAEEIVSQLYLALTALRPEETLTGVVFMGSGEPLLNLEATVRALKLMTHPSGLKLSHRKVTVSTVGIPARISELARSMDHRVSLAVSLHAPDDATRSRLVPGVRAPIRSILAALRTFPVAPGRKIMFEYVLVKGINDSPAHAESLARLLKGLPAKVNLLPLNPHDATDLQPPETEIADRFQQALMERGILTFQRRKRGDDQLAACGQLLSW